MDAILLKLDGNNYYQHSQYRQEIDLTKFSSGGSATTAASYVLDQNGEATIKEFLAQNKVEKNLFVTQTNSAHQLSYYMAREAFQYALRAKKNFQVINFDQHNDMQLPSSYYPPFACMNWGRRILDEKMPYSILGIGEEPGHFDSRAKGLDSFSMGKMLDAKKPIFSFSPTDLFYITVDMDVLCGALDVKRTNYPHGDLRLQELLDAIEQFPKNSVIAADITGLPPIVGTQPGIIDTYLKEIEIIGEKLQSKFIL